MDFAFTKPSTDYCWTSFLP